MHERLLIRARYIRTGIPLMKKFFRSPVGRVSIYLFITTFFYISFVGPAISIFWFKLPDYKSFEVATGKIYFIDSRRSSYFTQVGDDVYTCALTKNDRPSCGGLSKSERAELSGKMASVRWFYPNTGWTDGRLLVEIVVDGKVILDPNRIDYFVSTKIHSAWFLLIYAFVGLSIFVGFNEWKIVRGKGK